MQDPDEAQNNQLLAETRPSLLLRGERPRLIDEWQDAPQLWDAVRHTVDREQLTGAFILTGSAVPGRKPKHTGTGRISYLDMRTMSLAETGDSTGEVSLESLFETAAEPEGYSQKSVEDLAFLICRGGWPRATTLSQRASLRLARDYVTAVCDEDISRVDDVARDPQNARLIMREYARLTATSASLNTVRADLAAHGRELSKDTVNSYLTALKKIYVIEDLEAWSPSLRARSRIARTPARFFSDPSIAAAALGANPDGLLRDMATFGVLFEALCVHDLRVYADCIEGRVLRYHDNTGLEADAVITLPDGRYGLIEVKLGARNVEQGAAGLKKLAERLDTSVMGQPSFMAVVTPGGYAYRRDDGVLVIPITTLSR